MATLAEIYVAAALRVKTSLPRALHFLTVSGLMGTGLALLFTALTRHFQGKGLNKMWQGSAGGVSDLGLGLRLEPV